MNTTNATLQFGIDVSGATKLASLLGAVGADGLIKTTLTTAAIAVQKIARQEAPVRTGRLQNSIQYKVRGLEAEIGPKVQYGLYVEMGTGLYGPYGHLIEPKNSKVLATKSNPGFGSKNKGGYYVIGRYSRGQEANPFMQRTAVEAIPVVTEIFKMVPAGITKTLREVEV